MPLTLKRISLQKTKKRNLFLRDKVLLRDKNSKTTVLEPIISIQKPNQMKSVFDLVFNNRIQNYF